MKTSCAYCAHLTEDHDFRGCWCGCSNSTVNAGAFDTGGTNE